LQKHFKMKNLSSPDSIYHHLLPHVSFEQEEFWVLAMTSHLDLIQQKCLFRGTVDHCLIHPRDIFRYALSVNATGIVLVHTHPSGLSTPSHEDILVTKDLVAAAKLMKIPIWDHIIFTSADYFSFKKKHLL